MWLERQSGGGNLLLTRAEAKSYLRVLVDDFDDEVDDAIAFASAYLDVDAHGRGRCGGPLTAQAWRLYASRFSDRALRLPLNFVTAVDAVRYVPRGADAETTLSSDVYRVTKQHGQTVLQLKEGQSWPDLALRDDAVQIDFSAGFASAEVIDASIKGALRLLVAHHFHDRGPQNWATVRTAVQNIVDPFVKYKR